MESVPSLTPNPGGVLQPYEVIGRDALLDRYWKILERQSLLLLAPRRMGKTSICRVLQAQPRDNFLVKLRDVEGCESAARFVGSIREDANALLAHGLERFRKSLPRPQRWFKTIKAGPVEIELTDDQGERAWRTQLQELLEAVDERAGRIRHTVVFIWDEFPLFIDDLIDKGKADEAEGLLDGLRAFRDRSVEAHVRMIYTGSIGLPDIIERLRSGGYRNTPTNDMALEMVPLLDEDGAVELASALLQSLGRPIDDGLAQHVANASERHPFLIHHVVDQLSQHSRELQPAAVEAAIDALVAGPQDRLHLEHYLNRLSKTSWGPAARDLLDVIARTNEAGITLDQLENLLANQSRTELAERLAVLARDGYVVEVEGRYRFLLGFLARWWRHRRGLR